MTAKHAKSGDRLRSTLPLAARLMIDDIRYNHFRIDRQQGS
jgi:hypothetical protein